MNNISLHGINKALKGGLIGNYNLISRVRDVGDVYILGVEGKNYGLRFSKNRKTCGTESSRGNGKILHPVERENIMCRCEGNSRKLRESRMMSSCSMIWEV